MRSSSFSADGGDSDDSAHADATSPPTGRTLVPYPDNRLRKDRRASDLTDPKTNDNSREALGAPIVSPCIPPRTFEPNRHEQLVESDEHGQLSVGERHVELMAQETELDPFRQFGRRRLELHVRATTDGTLVQQRLLISVDLAWSVEVGKWRGNRDGEGIETAQ